MQIAANSACIQADIWLIAEAATSIDVSATISTLLQHTAPPFSLHVVAGEEQQAQLCSLLERINSDSVHLYPANTSWQDLIGRSTTHWIVLLHAGTLLVHDWLPRLLAAAEFSPEAGSISPVSNGTVLHSVSNTSIQALSAAQLDQIVAVCSDNRLLETPYWLPGLHLLRKAALAASEPLLSRAVADLESSFRLAEHLSWQGQLHLLYTGLCVSSQPSRGDLPLTRNQHEQAEKIQLAHPLTGLRYRVAQQAAAPLDAMHPLAQRPVRLHLMHNWGGGLERWVEDYCAADVSSTHLILRAVGTWGAFGQRLELHTHVHSTKPVAVWPITPAIRATAVASHAYASALREIIERFHVETILVSSLIGHALEALRLPIPTIVVCHDYYPYCQALYSFNGSPCQQCDKVDLQACKSGNPSNRFFNNVDAEEWHWLRQAYLQCLNRSGVQLVAPSPSVADNLCRLIPQLDRTRFHIIAHGIDMQTKPLMPQQHPRPRILLLGGIGPEKGLHLLRALFPALADKADVFLLGCGEAGTEFANYQGVHIQPRYSRQELPQLVEAISPDLGLLLSVVPETFSYTLSELFAFGIPVVATRLGSFADRIEHGRTGLLADPRPEALSAAINQLLTNQELRALMRQQIQKLPQRSRQQMIDDYLRLAPLPKYSLHRTSVDSAGLGRSDIVDRSWDPGKSFSDIIVEAKCYFEHKIDASPRLRPWQRKCLNTVCRAVFSLTFRINASLKHVR